ncbi:helix-turn-helix domain-containing protein [Streptomyces luomodiensis]|uniref:Helix-turn-helix domain-containing protein n=1 Tax=Streptomyces luomodiensis TaxID=3026192 RepID=A0ABY9V5I0_9ACTN|nr:helix-turn-helix domain-containing protein [Streptomyces sp. SCA4-21]WNF00064.1 helix-turn-helix domain-containing protein [Streptomyces sp. SCA4-21]
MAPPAAAHDPLLRRCLTLFSGFDGIEDQDEAAILRRAMAQVSAVGTGRAEAGYLRLVDGDGGGGLVRCPHDGARATGALDAQVRELAGRDGPVRFPRRAWGWAFGLRVPDGPHEPDGLHGALVVSYRDRPGEDERLLLRLLVRQTAAALATAAAHRRERVQAVELRRARDEREAIRRRLDSSLTDLDQLREVHDALARSAAHGDGEDGIVRTLHRITGLAAAAEDRFGNLRAWAGPGRPDPYPKPDPARREELLREAARRPRPVRVRDRLLAVADPRGEVLGALFLLDPDGRADARAVRALDQAATSLGLELAHLRELAEVELRLRRELVADLLAGTDDTGAYARSEALGHDLRGPHHVIVVRWADRPADDVFLKAVRRAAAGLGLRMLSALRSDTAVLVVQGAPEADGAADERSLHTALGRELGTDSGAVGVGGSCDTPREVPRSYQEALRALEVRRRSHRAHGMTFFDDLGLYRILRTGNDHREVERFVREWLGPLLDYDALHHTDLVETLSEYFDRGGNYSRTAEALVIHRSTLRYRLRRIREISGSDLADVDSRLNLHVATRMWKIMRNGPE